MLKVLTTAPPVPQVSMAFSKSAFTRTAWFRSDCARPAISAAVARFIRIIARNAAIWTSVTCPSKIVSCRAFACSKSRSPPLRMISRYCVMFAMFSSLPFVCGWPPCGERSG